MDTLVEDVPSIEEAAYARHFGRKVGQGAFREVYRVPGSRWAYKFERESEWRKVNGANGVEYANFVKFRASLPDGVDFPEMVMLDDGVVAAEFVEGVFGRDAHTWDDWRDEPTCNCKSHQSQHCWRKITQTIAMKDLHGGNVMIRKGDGKVIIIDIGEYGVDEE